jgi:rhodanese-related sulfurtransferase/DNA-binding transcriptional ArsR family regulator
MGDREKKAALFEQFARVGKAMANGKRLELIDLLAQGERSVESLTAAAGLGLSTASAHLQALKQAGLVTTRKEGARIYYDLAGPDVAGLYSLVRSVARAHVTDVEQKRADYLGVTGAEERDAGGEPVEMAREELLERASAGTVIVLDVRPPEEYRAAHIPSAVSIPLEELSNRLDELPAGREVVAYCRGAYCVLAYEAVDLLHSTGRRARRLHEGMLEWRLGGLPVEAGNAA